MTVADSESTSQPGVAVRDRAGRRGPRVLVLVKHYLPGNRSGGPVRTISNLVDGLGDRLDFRIITSDRDALDEEAYADVALDRWNAVGRANVYYASPEARSFRRLADLIRATPHDVLYLNSFFDPTFTVRPMLARALGLLPDVPVILAPRGELSDSARGLKRWKKKPYVGLASRSSLLRDVIWQASSEHEAEEIRRVVRVPGERIAVVPNVPARGPGRLRRPPSSPEDSMRLIFLSRITPMKNLDYALRVLSKVRIPVSLDIVGVVDDSSYWRTCRRLIRGLPGHVRVRYRGVVPHRDVARTLRRYDLFFLPTRNENYGHAISEALSSGVPVLISDRTPWRDLEKRCAGWDLPLDSPEEFAATIERFGSLSPEQRQRLTEGAVEFWERTVRSSDAVRRNLDMFLAAAAGR